ncbi:hypothetical protein SDJN03_13800, partial [Cucurbita argyrosperma subsp. sororia]
MFHQGTSIIFKPFGPKYHNHGPEIFRAMAAVSKTSFMALVAVLFTVVSVAVAQSAESPAPAPASPATSVVPSLSVACVGAFVALVFGSALKA